MTFAEPVSGAKIRTWVVWLKTWVPRYLTPYPVPWLLLLAMLTE
jgi:hypothetical protein